MSIRRAAFAVLVFVAWCSSAPAQQAGGARILRVDRREERVPSRNPMYRRMPKFSEASAGLVREVYEVHWAPPPSGLEAGSVLVFDYAQERADRVQSLTIQYPFVVRSPRKATFIISERAVLAAGRVTGWRVRLMQGRRALAEMASGVGRP